MSDFAKAVAAALAVGIIAAAIILRMLAGTVPIPPDAASDPQPTVTIIAQAQGPQPGQWHNVDVLQSDHDSTNWKYWGYNGTPCRIRAVVSNSGGVKNVTLGVWQDGQMKYTVYTVNHSIFGRGKRLVHIAGCNGTGQMGDQDMIVANLSDSLSIYCAAINFHNEMTTVRMLRSHFPDVIPLPIH
jgi:hypothetical protein